MKILGISHPVSLNPAACLIIDDKIVAFAEEERFNGIKHSPNLPANKSVSFCLKQGNISIEDLDYIALGHDNYLTVLKHNLPQKIGSFLKDYLLKDGQIASQNNLKLDGITGTGFGMISTFLNCYQGLSKLPFNYRDKRVKFVRHHLAHIASTYYPSGFDKAAIISMDGGGGQEAGMLAVGDGTDIKVIKTISTQNSLGYLYTTITELLDFERFDGEGKVMGLSSFADKNVDILPFVDFKDGVAVIDQQKMFVYLNKVSKRLSTDPLAKENRNLAGALQRTVEKAYVYMATYLYQKTGLRKFCLTGGVSLNCLANTKVLNLDFVDDLYIQPASNDAGTALGAALYEQVKQTGKPSQIRIKDAYFGPEFSNHQILTALKRAELPYFRFDKDIEKTVAKLLSKGKIIGWFQGKMEIGPRALGNRSILADPSNKSIKDKVNLRVKGREPWRPFAPSILEEYAKDYLIDAPVSPFMILSSRVSEKLKKNIVATMHVDDTVRPQTVSKQTNPRYWNLINEFKEITGIPVVLNTSFNLAGEPVVCSPKDAISAFFRTGMDYLIMGNYIVSKEPLNKI